MESDPSRETPTSEWQKLRNKSVGKLCNSQAKWILRIAVSKKAATGFVGVNAYEVYLAQKERDFCKASDWVCRLGPDVFLLYGCGTCHIYPMRSCDWLRTARMDTPESAPDLHEQKGNEWRTPCCGAKWSWGKDARWRLFVLGADPDSSTFEHSKYMYIGEDFGQRLENKIEFLKRCQLLKNLEGAQITCNSILEVIDRVNSATRARLMNLPEVRQITAIDPDTVPHYGCHWKLVCQDKRLSIPHAGKQIRVIDLRQGTGVVPRTMGAPELDFLVHVCAAMLDVEQAAQSPAEKDGKEHAEEHDLHCRQACHRRPGYQVPRGPFTGSRALEADSTGRQR